MKTIKSVIPKMLGFFLILTVICGVVFPLVVTGIAKVFFPKQATGSILVGEDGTKYGSELLGQQFTENKYLWGRIMNVDTSTFTGENGEPLMYSWASNKTPAGEELEELIAERVEKIREAQPEKEGHPAGPGYLLRERPGSGHITGGSRIPGVENRQGARDHGGRCENHH